MKKTAKAAACLALSLAVSGCLQAPTMPLPEPIPPFEISPDACEFIVVGQPLERIQVEEFMKASVKVLNDMSQRRGGRGKPLPARFSARLSHDEGFNNHYELLLTLDVAGQRYRGKGALSLFADPGFRSAEARMGVLFSRALDDAVARLPAGRASDAGDGVRP